MIVEDDGPGVPEPDRASLFEPFHQGRQAHGAANPGVGLGLTVVRAFTQLHGGTTWYEPVSPTGCRFHLTLNGGDVVTTAATQPPLWHDELVGRPAAA